MAGSFKIVNKQFTLEKNSDEELENKALLRITYYLSDGVSTQVVHSDFSDMALNEPMPDAATLENDEINVLEIANG